MTLSVPGGEHINLSNSKDNLINDMVGVKVGESIAFNCIESTLKQKSSLIQKVVFKKNNKAVISQPSTLSMRVNGASKTDDGVYHCEIENLAGRRSSNEINLKVLCKLILSIHC